MQIKAANGLIAKCKFVISQKVLFLQQRENVEAVLHAEKFFRLHKIVERLSCTRWWHTSISSVVPAPYR